jgi:hypothetical protein
MNENTPNPPSVPPQIPPGSPPSSYPPGAALGEIPEAPETISGLASAIESIFRQLFWIIAIAFGVRFLGAAFSHSNARSSAGLASGIIIFVLVVLQTSTALRPIVGQSENFLPNQKRFFIPHGFECIDKADKKSRSNDGLETICS